MRLVVITCVLNPGELLVDTRKSILAQDVPHGSELVHIIWDGGSEDGTRDSLQTTLYESAVVILGDDNGFYDALSKCLEKVPDGIHSYLNAGDMWFPNAAKLVLVHFKEEQESAWITGRQTIFNKIGDETSSRLPPRFKKVHILNGKYNAKTLPTIQQESTFWRSDHTKTLNLSELATFQFAGDAYIWNHLAQRASLKVLNYKLGGFRQHGNHLSSNMQGYRSEMALFSRKTHLVSCVTALLEKLLWRLPEFIISFAWGRKHPKVRLRNSKKQ